MNQVKNYIYEQSNDFREVLFFLRKTIIEIDPGIKEKIAYKIPFFYRTKPLCYLNSVKGGIDIGFWSGLQMKKLPQLLLLKNRKMIKTFFIPVNKEIDSLSLKIMLKEAIELDNSYK